VFADDPEFQALDRIITKHWVGIKALPGKAEKMFKLLEHIQPGKSAPFGARPRSLCQNAQSGSTPVLHS
jgi:hypothetical protein